jgi:hypothetical protein
METYGVIEYVERICQDLDDFEGDGRLVDFVEGLVMEEKRNFEQYEATGVLLDKNETPTISSNALGEITAEFINVGFAVGYLLGQTDFKSNNHLPQNVRKIMGEIKTRLIKERVLDPEVLPKNRLPNKEEGKRIVETKGQRERREDFAAGFLTCLIASDEHRQRTIGELDAELGEVLADLLQRGVVEIKQPLALEMQRLTAHGK